MTVGTTAEEVQHTAPAGEALLEVRDLSVVFGGRPPAEAVRGVSLTIARGQACGLVGESGSGKSSLAAALLGVLPVGGGVAAGSVVFDGRELTGLDEAGWRGIRGRRIAMVFQEASMALDPLMTVGGHLREALLLSASVRGRDADRRALELVREVGISDPERRLRQYPHELSGGMRQRILIALALAGDPELLIADEPTTALDVTVQAQILELLRARQLDRGMAMLLISHSLPIVSSVVDRVFVMYGGRIMESGPVRELFHAPRHPYTAALLVANPDVDRDLELRPIPGSPPSAHRLPPGCPFAPRCSYRQPRCDDRPPEPARISRDRDLACVVDPFRAA
jgi:oligopeptide/dipeptide ABC transporter ATP-binding protein